MALPVSGTITMGQVRTELIKDGRITLGDPDVRTLAQDDGGRIEMEQLYGRKFIDGNYVWTNIDATGGTVTLPFALSPGDNLMIVFRCGSAGNCGGTNYARVWHTESGYDFFNGAIAGYWGGQGANNWGQWRSAACNTSIPAGGTISLSRSADGCAQIGSTQMYIQTNNTFALSEAEYQKAVNDGWVFDASQMSALNDFTPVDNGSVGEPDTPRLAQNLVKKVKRWQYSVDFNGTGQETRSCTVDNTIEAGASCLVKGYFIKPGGNYNVTANIRIWTDAYGTFYEQPIASWYGGHGGTHQPLAGYEFTAPHKIPAGTTLYWRHYTNGQYGDGTSAGVVYLDVANIMG
jgi:hypothetical protein